MRSVVLLPILLMGCDESCETPRILDARTYTMFGNLIDFEATGTGAPLGNYPVNGYTTWVLQWGASDEGPVQLFIDDQAFDAEGRWSSTCNTFALDFGGIFTSDEGVRHIFEAKGDFLFYNTTLEGTLSWTDRWTFGESSGTIDASKAEIIGDLEFSIL